VSLNDETRGIVGEKEIRSMPKGAVILNIGRGPLIDQQALYDALAGGHLGGAGLDVFTPEPLPTDHPLLKLPGVIATPHCAGGDDENLVNEVEMFFSNIHRVLDGKPPAGIANGVSWAG
jgi:phosphoglycerate dehydrogenase-like enzyme